MIVVFGLATAAAGLLAYGFYDRKQIWDGIDFSNATADDVKNVNDADHFVQNMAVLQLILMIVGLILCAVWSKRIADNAKARGSHGVRPGLAAGGWFIPIGWLWVGFNQLKVATTEVGKPSRSLGVWQTMFIVQSVIGFIINRFGKIDESGSVSEVSDTLRNQTAIGVLGFVLLATTAFFANKAAHEIDEGVTGNV